jgi:hypothetical protein
LLLKKEEKYSSITIRDKQVAIERFVKGRIIVYNWIHEYIVSEAMQSRCGHEESLFVNVFKV